MCKFSAGILSKDGVYWLEDSDSHTEIISRLGLHQDGVRGPNLVQYEITPAAVVGEFDTWEYRVDQDILPDWYDAKRDEARARAALWRRFPEGLASITRLDASYSEITDVSALKNLTKLYANYSEITDVSALKNLTKLYASESKITDVSALKNLTKLYARGSVMKTWNRP